MMAENHKEQRTAIGGVAAGRYGDDGVDDQYVNRFCVSAPNTYMQILTYPFFSCKSCLVRFA
jgi:hypothetical protein